MSSASTGRRGDGAVVAFARIQGGASVYQPIPLTVVQAITQLSAEAKVAYACQSFEETSFVNSKLLGFDAHTSHRIMPMCFEADVKGPPLGAPLSEQTPDADFCEPRIADARPRVLDAPSRA